MLLAEKTPTTYFPLMLTLGMQMIRIRQHGEESALFDIKQFLPDIDIYFKVDGWLIEIEWCQGKDAKTIEEETVDGKVYTDAEFRKLYSGIFQTIDGSFQIMEKNENVVKLLAVDSSFWEVESNKGEFEQHMLSKYGEYKYNT